MGLALHALVAFLHLVSGSRTARAGLWMCRYPLLFFFFFPSLWFVTCSQPLLVVLKSCSVLKIHSAALEAEEAAWKEERELLLAAEETRKKVRSSDSPLSVRLTNSRPYVVQLHLVLNRPGPQAAESAPPLSFFTPMMLLMCCGGWDGLSCCAGRQGAGGRSCFRTQCHHG